MQPGFYIIHLMRNSIGPGKNFQGRGVVAPFPKLKVEEGLRGLVFWKTLEILSWSRMRFFPLRVRGSGNFLLAATLEIFSRADGNNEIVIKMQPGKNTLFIRKVRTYLIHNKWKITARIKFSFFNIPIHKSI